MNDSSQAHDGVTVLAALAIIVVAWVGIGAILSDNKDKDVAIADIKQQLSDAKRGIDLCEGRFQGCQQGRR